jgi:hypothetical protein
MMALLPKDAPVNRADLRIRRVIDAPIRHSPVQQNPGHVPIPGPLRIACNHVHRDSIDRTRTHHRACDLQLASYPIRTDVVMMVFYQE